MPTVPGIIRRPENLRIFLQATDIQSEDTAGSSVLPWSIIPRSENTGTGSEPLEIENISVDLLAEYTGLYASYLSMGTASFIDGGLLSACQFSVGVTSG